MDKMITFTRQRKTDPRKHLAEVQITVRGNTMKFNVEATRYQGMYLDTGLQFWAHKNISLEKAKQVEDRVRRLGSTYGLDPVLIRRV